MQLSLGRRPGGDQSCSEQERTKVVVKIMIAVTVVKGKALRSDTQSELSALHWNCSCSVL